MPRKPNAECEHCLKKYYKRPSQQKFNASYCSRLCYAQARTKWKKCPCCNIDFNPKQRNQKFCSKSCGLDGRKKRERKGGKVLSRTDGRLKVLREEFNFDSCMVKGCNYNRTYDVHRLIPGSCGGKYEIGNMFAICPNHHAECHRKIITLKKEDDKTLIAVVC